MAFSKNFPRKKEGSNYTEWEEIELTGQEETDSDENARQDGIRLMKECLEDAKSIVSEKGYKEYQSDIVHMAISLFEKRASHSVYWKESKAKEKFDSIFKDQKA